jgi:hypothetical protein
MRMDILILLFLFMIGCSPKIDRVTYEDEFKKWNRTKQINEVDSSSSMSIYFNTYKGLFEGRESFMSFKKNRYSIDFKKSDTLYTEKDIKYFSVSGYYMKDTSFIPKYCKVRIKHISEKRIIIDFEIKDDSIGDVLKGKFKLKLDQEFPEHFDVFKYYKN